MEVTVIRPGKAPEDIGGSFTPPYAPPEAPCRETDCDSQSMAESGCRADAAQAVHMNTAAQNASQERCRAALRRRYPAAQRPFKRPAPGLARRIVRNASIADIQFNWLAHVGSLWRHVPKVCESRQRHKPRDKQE